MIDFIDLEWGRIQADALVCEIDCVGNASKTFSNEWKKSFPDAIQYYQELFDAGELEPGQVFVFERKEKVTPRYIFMPTTRTHWNGERLADRFDQCMHEIVEQVLARGIKSIGLPIFSTGRGLNGLQIKMKFLATFARIPDVKLMVQSMTGPSTATAIKQVTISTDGGADPSSGAGGYGVVLRFGKSVKELSGGFQRTSSNRMELMAVIVGLEALKEVCRVRVYSDSRYIVDTVNTGVLFRFCEPDLSIKPGKANGDLWKRLLDAYLKHEVELLWVKGHSGIEDNERCDELATLALRSNSLLVDEGFQGKVKKGKASSKALRLPGLENTSPPPASPSGGPKGPKPKKVGDLCRYCHQPLIRRQTKKSSLTSSYYYAWYLYCQQCRRLYHVEEAKVFRDQKTPPS